MSAFETALLSCITKLKYEHFDAIKTDVTHVLGEFVDLDYTEDMYVYEDGFQKKLLKIKGTIPVKFEGSDFNVPISIWLSKRHPHRPPIVYVVPSSRMHVMSGNFVDMNGKVHIPYLSEWNFPNSDLLSLLQIMTTVFSDELPVRSRITSQTSQTGDDTKDKDRKSRDVVTYSDEVEGRTYSADGIGQNSVQSGSVPGRRRLRDDS